VVENADAHMLIIVQVLVVVIVIVIVVVFVIVIVVAAAALVSESGAERARGLGAARLLPRGPGVRVCSSRAADQSGSARGQAGLPKTVLDYSGQQAATRHAYEEEQ